MNPAWGSLVEGCDISTTSGPFIRQRMVTTECPPFGDAAGVSGWRESLMVQRLEGFEDLEGLEALEGLEGHRLAHRQ